jgi:subtilisin family serine protease
MSADPVSSLLGGPIQQHGIEDAPSVVHHTTPNADFWIDSWPEREVETLFGDVQQTLASAHHSTGLTSVRNDYGFTGAGQTVAVIDSGIAWSHSALGGGLGASYRVVGGWDFTENDADPYDDGPWGSHGTHVAGIVGANADGANYDGVATGVDLIGLRVFDDAGAGYFHWVESALQWVHQHRHAFENPITAVNLSLGTTWNSSSIPTWATLEDEFAQLKADGIFIAVSAGNAFAANNTPGLSYPAASPHVVPVMSVMDNGSLSSFSQRHTRAIAAPGQYIVSTIPDYVGNGNGLNDDFASFSGTSMAAPYVAGASVLLRQAMQFVGYTNITQDTIYTHMMSTATSFLDAATGQTYKRINLTNAFNALMPTDEYGSTAATAHDLGTLSGESEVSGLIGKLSDTDFFRFTAAATGTVRFTASVTHGLAPVWSATGGTVSGSHGEAYTFDVVAGQSYTVGLSTGSGIGFYELAIEAESMFMFADWGTITQFQSNVANAGETWYRVTASRAGHFTTEALFAAASGNIDLGIYDSNRQLLVSGTANAAGERIDFMATAETSYFVRVTGTNADVDFRLTNLVTQTGTTLDVAGSSAADTFLFAVGATQHTVSVNGAAYHFSRSAVTAINLNGSPGIDKITMTGSTGNDTATLSEGNVQLVGSGYSVVASDMENVTVRGGGGANDTAQFYDTAGEDSFTAWSNRAYMGGSGYSHTAGGFDVTTADASLGGFDRATFYDSAGDDVYSAGPDVAGMAGTGYTNEARGFDRDIAYSTAGGADHAMFHDSPGDDTYAAWSDKAIMYGSGFRHEARRFERTIAHAAGGGFDRAIFNDSAGDDAYEAWANRAIMHGSGYHNDARGFDRTIAHSRLGGNDRADFYDSTADDVYAAWSRKAVMYGAGYNNDARGFGSTTAHATQGGFDKAVFYTSASQEELRAMAWGAYISDPFYRNEARGFERVSALNSNDGSDDVAYVDAVDFALRLYGDWEPGVT